MCSFVPLGFSNRWPPPWSVGALLFQCGCQWLLPVAPPASIGSSQARSGDPCLYIFLICAFILSSNQHLAEGCGKSYKIFSSLSQTLSGYNWWFDEGQKLNRNCMSEMSKCNTGISLSTRESTAFSSSIQNKINRESSPTSSHACTPEPTLFCTGGGNRHMYVGSEPVLHVLISLI